MNLVRTFRDRMIEMQAEAAFVARLFDTLDIGNGDARMKVLTVTARMPENRELSPNPNPPPVPISKRLEAVSGIHLAGAKESR